MGLAGVDIVEGQEGGQAEQFVAAGGNKQRIVAVTRSRKLLDDRPGVRYGKGIVSRDLSDKAAVAGGGLLKRLQRRVAVRVARRQNGEAGDPLPGGVIDHPVDLCRRIETHDPNAAPSDRPVVGEGDDRNLLAAGLRRGCCHRGRKERAEDEVGPFVQSGLHCLLGAFRPSAGVVQRQLEVWTADIE